MNNSPTFGSAYYGYRCRDVDQLAFKVTEALRKGQTVAPNDVIETRFTHAKLSYNRVEVDAWRNHIAQQIHKRAGTMPARSTPTHSLAAPDFRSTARGRGYDAQHVDDTVEWIISEARAGGFIFPRLLSSITFTKARRNTYCFEDVDLWMYDTSQYFETLINRQPASTQHEESSLDTAVLPPELIPPQFGRTKILEGYEINEVDAAIEDIQYRYASGAIISPEEIVEMRFQATKFRAGYDQDDVDEWLDTVVTFIHKSRSVA